MTDAPAPRSSEDVIDTAVASLRRELVQGYHAEQVARILAAKADAVARARRVFASKRDAAKARNRRRNRVAAASRKMNRRAA